MLRTLPRMSVSLYCFTRLSKCNLKFNGCSVIEAEILCQLFDIIASKHPETKFVKSVATKCVENFKDRDVPALLFYHNNVLTGNLIPCGELMGGKRMTVDTVEYVLSLHKQIDIEFEADPRDKLKLMNTVVKRGNAAGKTRHEKDADSDEEGTNDRDYINNQYKMYK